MSRSSPRKKHTVNYDESHAISHTNGVEKKAFPNVRSAISKVMKKRKKPSEDNEKTVVEESINTTKKRKEASEDNESTVVEESTKTTKKRKITKGKEDDAMPLGERTVVSSLKMGMYIGAHVSAAGGIQNAVTNAVHIGANSFALFLKPHRKWDNPPLAPEARDLFMSNCRDHIYSAAEHALPHGSYLVNLAQSDNAKATQAYNAFVDDLARCDELGIKLYNFHPGSTLGDTKAAACKRIAAQLNKSHKATKSVITVLENMAGGGNIVGSTWEDLRDIIALVEDKDRVGVCIDTCHAFAAGHDLRTPEAFRKTMDTFNEVVGAKYLKAFHLNDSKAPFGSNRDLHANIGTGFLGLRAFHCVMNEDAFRNMPMVLETPINRKGPDGKSIEDKQIWANEIKLLESLIGMDPECDEFKKFEKELQSKGAAERNRIQEQVDKKATKDAKKGTRKGGAKKKKKKHDTDDESE